MLVTPDRCSEPKKHHVGHGRQTITFTRNEAAGANPPKKAFNPDAEKRNAKSKGTTDRV